MRAFLDLYDENEEKLEKVQNSIKNFLNYPIKFWRSLFLDLD